MDRLDSIGLCVIKYSGSKDQKLYLRYTGYFQVRYAPKVSLSKIDRIVEGSELRFRCCAEANPPDVEYR